MFDLIETQDAIRRDYLSRAKAMKKAGWVVTDSDTFESLVVECKEENIYYEFKYDDREHLKSNYYCPAWLKMDFEDYILAMAVNW